MTTLTDTSCHAVRDEESRESVRLHGVISGALGQGNLGDDALLEAFWSLHGSAYDGATVLYDGTDESLKRFGKTYRLPLFAIGRRFWKGAYTRWSARRHVEQSARGAACDYVALGGLLSHIESHNAARYQEWKWASRFCKRLVYYFGDVGDGFAATPQARLIASLLNSRNAWVAVRSPEAGELLESAGVRTPIHIGTDPVLYRRIVERGVPFKRVKLATDILAIVPCRYRVSEFASLWLRAAECGVRHGLRIRWVSLCDPTDLGLCQSLSEQFQSEFPRHPQEIVNGSTAESGLWDACVCVASRFHGAVFSVTSGVPTITVPYTSKVRHLFQSLRLDEWICSTEPPNHPTIEQQIDATIEGHWKLDSAAVQELAAGHRAALNAFSETLSGTKVAGTLRVP